MSRAAFNVLNILGPIVLALMGAVIALWPPASKGRAKVLWFAGFLVIGSITALSAYVLKDDLDEMIMGGRHFCYFKTMPSEAKNLDGPFQLWLVAPNGPVFDLNYWISEAGTTAKDAGYWSLDQNKPLYPIIHDGGHAWDRVLPTGNYRIEFDGRNGHWVEELKIAVKDGKLAQSIRVIGFGGKLLLEEQN
jgi:hypothetical protein